MIKWGIKFISFLNKRLLKFKKPKNKIVISKREESLDNSYNRLLKIYREQAATIQLQSEIIDMLHKASLTAHHDSDQVIPKQ